MSNALELFFAVVRVLAPRELHLEWEAPTYGDAKGPGGQGRGNSGVFFFGRYENRALKVDQLEKFHALAKTLG